MNNVKSRFQSLPVSVIIPVFNTESYLEECIQSVNEGIPPAEILIIDDQSTDGSFNAAKRLSTIYPNIRVLQNDKNMGAAVTREKGIANSQHDLISFVDADDFLECNALSDAYSLIEANVDMVIWQIWKYKNCGEAYKLECNPSKLPLSGSHAVMLTLGGWRMHAFGIARKKIYLKAYDDFKNEVNCYNSDELITRLALKNCRLIIGSTKKYFYRLNPDSSTQVFSDKHVKALRAHIFIINLCLGVQGAPVRKCIEMSICDAYNYFKRRDNVDKNCLFEEVLTLTSTLIKNSKYWTALLLDSKTLLKSIVLFVWLFKYKAVH